MIREAVEADIPQIVALRMQLQQHHVRVAPKSYGLSTEGIYKFEIETLMKSDKEYKYWVVEQENRIVAYVFFEVKGMTIKGVSFMKHLNILNFVVEEGERRNGIGTELMQGIVDYAAVNELPYISLEVAHGNEAAYDFYQKMGFEPQKIEMHLTLNEKEKPLL